MSGEKVKPGHKRTEVGVIPEDWEAVKLGDLLTVVGGGAFKSTDATKHGTRWLKIANVGINKISWSDESYLPNFFQSKHKCFLLKKGDFVLALTRPILDGKLKIARIKSDDEPSLLNQRVGRIDVLGWNDSEYIYHMLQTESHVRAMLQSMAGTDPPNLSSRGIYSILCATSRNFHEQHSIATALSDVDALLAKLDQLIAKKRDLKQATMQQLLTGQTRLPGFSGEWVMKRLGDVANIKTGGKNNQDKVDDGEYPFFVRSATVERINSYSHECEAILVPGEGGIGSIFHYINGRFDVHQRVYAITQFQPNVSGKYVHLYMSTHFGNHAMQNSVKATVDSLRLPNFQCFELRLPPTFDEQCAIATVLTDLDAELTNLEIRRDKTRALKQGMMQELLTGRIRLV